MPPDITLDDVAPRDIRAAGPAPDAESLRIAYLDLLKLALCDLAGARTESVGLGEDKQLFMRELTDDQLRVRIGGMDWPSSGLTMIGLNRLDDLQRCVETIARERVHGDLIEAGAWRGGASILMRATLDSLGATDRSVWVADSFEGFPPPDPKRFPADRDLDLSDVDFLAVPLDQVQAYFSRFGCERGVRFVPGFFAQTLPALRGRRWSLVRIDSDSYEATWIALESLYPSLVEGGYAIVDDYPLVEECRRAVDDFRRKNDITEPMERIDWIGVRWRRS
jgi:O-methyltransferase